MPQETSTMYISWPTIGVICSVLTLVIMVVSRVMQQSIKAVIVESNAALEEKIEKKFSSKESVEGELKVLNIKMSHIEKDVNELKQLKVQIPLHS